MERPEFLLPDRSEILKNPIEDNAKKFEALSNEFKKYVDTLEVDELKDFEQEIIKLAEEWDNKKIKEIKYILPKFVEYDKRKVHMATIGNYICDLIAKIECEYSYTLGYLQIYDWWSAPKTEAEYSLVDSTLNVLGSLKFKGPESWRKILTINEYFKSIHNEYSTDNLITLYWATLHNCIIDNLKLKGAIKEDPIRPGEIVAE